MKLAAVAFGCRLAENSAHRRRVAMPCLAAGLLAVALAGCATSPTYEVVDVRSSLETAPAGQSGDSADDPAIWVHPEIPSRSRILATNKQEGLVVYGLDGAVRQRLPVGPINNVDLRPTPDRMGDLAVASHDGRDAISLFDIDRDSGEVVHTLDIATGKTEPYGICLGILDDRPTAGVTYKDGTLQLWTFIEAGGDLNGVLTRIASVGSQPEGCVFDETHNRLFMGEEAVGLWSLDLSDPDSDFVAVDTVDSGSGLVADVEGVSIWRGADGLGFLVASAQEADHFVVYDRLPPHAVRGVFRVGENQEAGIDAVTHTDGLDIVSDALPGYPAGLLVVQDDGNPAPEQNQNFKLIDWRAVSQSLQLGAPEATSSEDPGS